MAEWKLLDAWREIVASRPSCNVAQQYRRRREELSDVHQLVGRKQRESEDRRYKARGKQGWQDAPHASHVERGEPVARRLIARFFQQLSDQITGYHENDIDSNISPVEPWNPIVKKNDGNNGERPQAIDVGAVCWGA